MFQPHTITFLILSRNFVESTNNGKNNVVVFYFKGTWHENFEKLNLAIELADKVIFHLNISSTMQKTKQTCKLVSRLDVYRRKLCFFVLFRVMTTVCNFQATFPLISPKVFGIVLTPNFATEVRKIGLYFWYQNQTGFEIICENDVVDHWQALSNYNFC